MRRRLTDAMLFYPERGQSRTPAHLGIDFEEIWLSAADGVRTQAWWIPGSGRGPVVVMFHGNAGTMADRLENAACLLRLGVSMLMAEYRGYGDSEGRPSESALCADARLAIAAARRRSGGRPVIGFGRSLGGAVAIDAAVNSPVDGLAVESTFTSLPELAAKLLPLPFASRFVAYRFDSIGKISRVDVPLLVVHGDADEMIPFAMAQRLHDAASRSPWRRFHLVRGADHNGTLLAGGDPYWQAWRELLAVVQGEL